MVEKKVNVGQASTKWIILMFIPIINCFVLSKYASGIFNKKYRNIGLICGIIMLVWPVIGGIVSSLGDMIILIVTLSPFVAYVVAIIAAFMMLDEYKYRKGVLKFADKYHVVYNDFETAEKEVIEIAAKAFNNDSDVKEDLKEKSRIEPNKQQNENLRKQKPLKQEQKLNNEKPKENKKKSVVETTSNKKTISKNTEVTEAKSIKNIEKEKNTINSDINNNTKIDNDKPKKKEIEDFDAETLKNLIDSM